jgi:hypothetical protein
VVAYFQYSGSFLEGWLMFGGGLFSVGWLIFGGVAYFHRMAYFQKGDRWFSFNRVTYFQ